MSDDERPGHETPGDATPWWSRPSGDSWDAPSYATSPTAPTAPTVPVPPDESLRGAENPTQPVPGPAGPPPYSGYAGSPWDPPGSPRPPDTLGSDPRPRHGPRAGVLVTLAILIALLAGGTGGAAGYLIAEHQDRSVTVDGANLGAAPARSVERPAGSVAGVAAKVLPSVVQIKVETANGGGTGSGFVVDADGLIVTNNHVVAGATSPSVSVTFADGTTTSARVVGRSASYDLAVVKVNAKNLKPLPLGNSDSVVVGDPVIAIGSPLGLSGTVTSGIVSAKDRRVTAGESSDETAYINAIQTDAAINPGNSGGPLVNLQGEVIGVNSAIATVGGSLTGQGGNIGLGFAIPINQARKTAEQIITTGAAQFPIIGASLDGRYTGDGARIATSSSSGGTPPLVPGGPADKAGLRPGDIIVAIDGKRVQGSSELIVAIRSKSPGDSVTLTVQRGGSERDYRVTLGSSKG